jgi:predicted DNA-binding protein (UPF0251 family)
MHMLTAEIVTSCVDADSGARAAGWRLAGFRAVAGPAGRPNPRPERRPAVTQAYGMTRGCAGARDQGEQAGTYREQGGTYRKQAGTYWRRAQAARCGQSGPRGRSEQSRPGGAGAQLRSLFEEAAAGLKLDEREVIELQLRQGLATAEVANVLGVSPRRAYLLLSRARDHLEACLSVLLVGRAGRGECGELACLLTGWDGRLTAALRKRVSRHIRHCATCKARRAVELRPRLLDLPPGTALAAGAAESFSLALGAPAALRARTIALAAGRGPDGADYRSAVLARAGSYGERGFPRPSPAAGLGLARPYGISALRAGLRAAGHGRFAVAAVAAAVAALAAAVAAAALATGPVHVSSATSPRSQSSFHRSGPADYHRPFISNYRQLRSWIEQNRLR